LGLDEGDIVEIKQATLETCGAVTGAVVVIDVIRAFTTAAHAFDAGAEDIILVSAVQEALALRERMPGALLMGEDGGWPIEGFDLGNSPAALLGRNLAGRRMIQRTSQGTQGVVRSTRAEALLTASFTVASATARYLQRLSPASVTFVTTGAVAPGFGDEDVACADYLTALLRGARPDVEPFLSRVRNSGEVRIMANPSLPQLSLADLDCCLAVDRFDFAMRVWRREGLLVMETVKE
jgi:2-phosphosulfolactate phosphatase